MAWLVVFRNVSTGELEPFRVKAWSAWHAIDVARIDLARKFPSASLGQAWEKFSVNRCES